jgi:hypothetical protein
MARFGNQKAPRLVTIALAAVLVLVGVIGTFLHSIPTFAGVSGETAGIAAYVLAALLMLVGIFSRGM